MSEAFRPMNDEEWREWVRQAAEDMSISKKARLYWQGELRKLEAQE